MMVVISMMMMIKEKCAISPSIHLIHSSLHPSIHSSTPNTTVQYGTISLSTVSYLWAPPWDIDPEYLSRVELVDQGTWMILQTTRYVDSTRCGCRCLHPESFRIPYLPYRSSQSPLCRQQAQIDIHTYIHVYDEMMMNMIAFRCNFLLSMRDSIYLINSSSIYPSIYPSSVHLSTHSTQHDDAGAHHST